MGAEALRTLVAIVTAFVGLAILATLLSKNATTLGVIQNTSSGIAQDIQAATAPLNATLGGSNTYSFAAN